MLRVLGGILTSKHVDRRMYRRSGIGPGKMKDLRWLLHLLLA